jgi:hypothetical protein
LHNYTVLKTRQISEKIREEVPRRENFPVIRGNDDYFPRITGKFSLQGTSSSLSTKIFHIFGTRYIAQYRNTFFNLKINTSFVRTCTLLHCSAIENFSAVPHG